jgi:hypothetical protein
MNFLKSQSVAKIHIRTKKTMSSDSSNSSFYGYSEEYRSGASAPKFYESGAVEYAKYLAQQMTTPQNDTFSYVMSYGSSYRSFYSYVPACSGCGPVSSSDPYRGKGNNSPF